MHTVRQRDMTKQRGWGRDQGERSGDQREQWGEQGTFVLRQNKNQCVPCCWRLATRFCAGQLANFREKAIAIPIAAVSVLLYPEMEKNGSKYIISSTETFQSMRAYKPRVADLYVLLLIFVSSFMLLRSLNLIIFVSCMERCLFDLSSCFFISFSRVNADLYTSVSVLSLLLPRSSWSLAYWFISTYGSKWLVFSTLLLYLVFFLSLSSPRSTSS